MPEPVATPDGEWLVSDGSGPWRAWRRVDGPGSVGDARRRRTCTPPGRSSAGSTACWPTSTRRRSPRRCPGFHDPGRRLDALRAVIAADPCGRVATVQDEIDMASDGRAARRRGRRPRSLGSRRRVAHFDAKVDNVLFAGDDAVCLVDFDTVMPGAWFWDVGDLLRSGATTAAEDDPDPDRAVVDAGALPGDRRRLPATACRTAGVSDDAELEAVEAAGAVVTYEQAVRFLTDWIAGDVYYRISRPAQNLDRARAQFRLLASMPRTMTQVRRHGRTAGGRHGDRFD